MSPQSKSSSRLSPSAIVVAVTILLLAVCALLGISFVVGAWNNPLASQVAARPIQAVATATLDATAPLSETVAPREETVVPAEQETVFPTFAYTPNFPPEATPYPTFDPSFVPTIAPRDNWATYFNEVEGYSIEYPLGWNIRQLPLENRQVTDVTSLTVANYDPSNPALLDLKGPLPRHLFTLEITRMKGGENRVPIPPSQSIEEWVHENKTPPEGMTIVTEGGLQIGGIEAYRLILQESGGRQVIDIWFPRENDLFLIEYFVYSDKPELMEAAGGILASFQFTR